MTAIAWTGLPDSDPAGAPRGSSSTRSVSGAVLFARYAYPPNHGGLCGPDDSAALREAMQAGSAEHASAHPQPTTDPRAHVGALAQEAERALRRLALDFEGALPYLQLIASTNAIADPLDARVVEAYWIGNELADRVRPALLHRFIDENFRRRLSPDDWRWLASCPAAGAIPTHAFHVFDVFPRVGLMRGAEVSGVLDLMDACRIRWGRVTEVTDEQVLVRSPRLEMHATRIRLGRPRPETLLRVPHPVLTDGLQPGAFVSIHWGWICEVLSRDRLARLVAHTRAQLRVTNQAI